MTVLQVFWCEPGFLEGVGYPFREVTNAWIADGLSSSSAVALR
jgi:hypothetical protein